MNFVQDEANPVTLSPQIEDSRVLVPSDRFKDVGSFLAATRRLRCGLPPFALELCAIVAELGGEILKSPELKHDTGAVALAFWLRKANIERIKEVYFHPLLANLSLQIMPVGRVFHLAPANVDTIFLYSWTLSFLCGNANIVRLSSSLSSVTRLLLECLARVMKRHELLRNYNLFMTCTHESGAIAQCSMWCTQRVVWGGDVAISQIRAIPLPTHASERVFATKHSYAVFSFDQITVDSHAQIEKVAHALFNDIFQFNQQACSSPHIIFWLGASNEMTYVIERIEQALLLVIKQRNLDSNISTVVQRFSQACELAAKQPSIIRLHDGGFTSIEQHSFEQNSVKGLCGGGFIRHLPLASIEELGSYAEPSDQTVTHYGLDKSQVALLAQVCGGNGVDRIVPVGQALDFLPVWDGYDLIGDFIHRVHVTP